MPLSTQEPGGKTNFRHAAFDLNDTEREPTDEQLATLMEAVAAEARKRAEAARKELAGRLRDAITAARRLGTAA